MQAPRSSSSSLPAAAAPVSLEDLARHLKLAVGTVSRALNGSERVNSGTRERVIATARELGYRPSPLARGLRMGRSGLVGICFYMNSPSRNMVISTQLYFLQKLLQSEGKRTLVEFSAWEYEDKLRAMEHFAAMRAEGIIHVGSFPRELIDPLEQFRSRGIPYVLLNSPDPTLPFSVSLHRTAAYEKIADHVLALGHRRLVMLGMTADDATYNSRIKGVRNALSRWGLEFESCVSVCFVQPERLESSADYGYRLAERFFPELSAATACLASNDDVAVGAIAFLKSRGVRVPADLSIVGFDDSIPYNDPALTTVGQEIERSAQAAVATLRAASVPGAESVAPVVIEPTLRVRQSTGPAPRVVRGVESAVI